VLPCIQHVAHCSPCCRYDRAAAIYSSRGWWDKLAVLVRQLDPSRPPEQRLLQQCAKQLQAAGQYQLAKEALMKLGDMAALMALYVQHSKWEDALLMVHAHPECRCGRVPTEAGGH
jgi:intraflagellar transport protein 122